MQNDMSNSQGRSNDHVSLFFPFLDQSDGYDYTSLDPSVYPPTPNPPLFLPVTPDNSPQYLLTSEENLMQALRQENVNLKIANIELTKQFNSLLMLQSPPPLQNRHASRSNTAPSPALFSPSLTDDFGGMRITDQKQTALVDETEDRENVDVKRVALPKSISIRSDGYMKTVQAGASTSRGRGRVRPLNRKPVNTAQKVYVRGGRKEENPLELQVYPQGMSKTELCNKWQQTGACPYGDLCQFAHGIEELRPVIRHPRYKTEVCSMVLNGVPCPYGHRCHFRHSLTDEERLVAQQQSNKVRSLRLI